MLAATALRYRLKWKNRMNQRKLTALEEEGKVESVEISEEVADTDPRYVFVT